jgi:hypothetical protein|tara:strand:+ start:17499 stop:17930 length:432 start_codon:yes stop_codon:yes gene_type:complete
MSPNDSPIGRDVKTESADPFGNITGNPNMSNLMADPLGTEIVAGLTGPISAQSLPTDVEDVMGQPPQVNFDGGGGGADSAPNFKPSDDDSTEVKNEIMEAENGGAIMELIDSAKSLVARNWKWLVPVGGVAVVGAVMYSRRKP